MSGIKVAAVTGGDCGGKTTLMKMAVELFEQHGIIPVVVPEAATTLFSSGRSPETMGGNVRFQEYLLMYQLHQEERYRRLAYERAQEEGREVVLLCDRGAIDIKAYLGASEYYQALNHLGFTEGELRDRYDVVVHLVTAADGAQQYYTFENNTARVKRTIEEVIALDQRTQAAWCGHRHHFVIDNSTDFAGKMTRALRAFQRSFKMPTAKEIERKFVVHNFDPARLPESAVATDIVQDYLTSDGASEQRVRASTTDGKATYYFTKKWDTPRPGERDEMEEKISREHYTNLRQDRDPAFATIEKTRHTFMYEGHKFELDVFHKGGPRTQGLVMMEVELPSIDEPVTLPPWLTLTEVTGDKAYKNKSLAKP